MKPLRRFVSRQLGWQVGGGTRRHIDPLERTGLIAALIDTNLAPS